MPNFYGRWMRAEAAKRIGDLYPKMTVTPGGTGKAAEASVIAWLWARTVPSPDPRARGVHVPLASSFILSAKKSREVVVVPIVDRVAMTWRFEVKTDPTEEEIDAAKYGTKSAKGQDFLCILTGAPIKRSDIQSLGKAGGIRQRLMAIVAEGKRSRIYLSPNSDQEQAALSAGKNPGVQEARVTFLKQPTPTRAMITGGVCSAYGLSTWGHLFTDRQLVALTTLSGLVGEARTAVLAAAEARWRDNDASDMRALASSGTGATAYADAVATYLAFSVSKMADLSNSLCRWEPVAQCPRQLFARQAMPLVWDFAEGNPLGSSSGSFSVILDGQTKALSSNFGWLPKGMSATITIGDAALNNFAEGTVFSTDPPYYDNIAYADLADFFYVWQRHTLSSVHPDLYRRVVTPKADELVATVYRHGSQDAAEAFFMLGMQKEIRGMSKATAAEPIAIYYAFKQSEIGGDGVTSPGWSSFLQAVHDCGLTIDGTWPVRSETSGRLIAHGSNALASSIVLVCRGRSLTAPSITTADIKRSLRREMPTAIADIRAGGVGPTDIQQAAIGPGIGIFTRHASVLNPDGSTLTVKDALKLVNAVREEIASGDDADYDAPTRFALDWFAGHGFGEGASGAAITMAGALGLGLDDLTGSGVAVAGHGKTRVIAVGDLKPGWDPVADKTPTAWEACHHLVRLLTAEDGGIDAAAQLHARLGTLAEPARALAERLYGLADGKGQAAAAYGYKSLYDDWPAIEARARDMGGIQAAGSERAQGSLL